MGDILIRGSIALTIILLLVNLVLAQTNQEYPLYKGIALKAKGDQASFNNNLYSAAKLSLTIPVGKPEKGKGTLLLQNGSNRASYQFIVKNATLIGGKTIIINIEGKIRTRTNLTNESSIITIDRINKTATITSNLIQSNKFILTNFKEIN